MELAEAGPAVTRQACHKRLGRREISPDITKEAAVIDRAPQQPAADRGRTQPRPGDHMFAPRHIHRATVGCGLVCVLLLTAVMSPPAAADAGPHDERSAAARDGARTSNLPGTTSTPRQDLRSADSRGAARAEDIALAQERYLSSSRESVPLALPRSRLASDGTPWLPIAATLAIVSAGAARLCHLGIGRARAA